MIIIGPCKRTKLLQLDHEDLCKYRVQSNSSDERALWSCRSSQLLTHVVYGYRETVTFLIVEVSPNYVKVFCFS